MYLSRGINGLARAYHPENPIPVVIIDRYRSDGGRSSRDASEAGGVSVQVVTVLTQRPGIVPSTGRPSADAVSLGAACRRGIPVFCLVFSRRTY